jgi:UDP-glucose 6-dehydrogenase
MKVCVIGAGYVAAARARFGDAVSVVDQQYEAIAGLTRSFW